MKNAIVAYATLLFLSGAAFADGLVEGNSEAGKAKSKGANPGYLALQRPMRNGCVGSQREGQCAVTPHDTRTGSGTRGTHRTPMQLLTDH